MGKLSPASLRCPSHTKAGWCYRVKREPKKGFVVQYRLPDRRHQTIGYLGKDCRMTYELKQAASFKTKEAADLVSQKCILYTRKPGGKDPKVIYKRAR